MLAGVESGEWYLTLTILHCYTPVVGVKRGGLYGSIVTPVSVTPDPVQSQAGVRLDWVEPVRWKCCVRCSSNSPKILKTVLWKYCGNSMVCATLNSDGKLTGTGARLPLPPARQGSLGLLLQLKIPSWIRSEGKLFNNFIVKLRLEWFLISIIARDLRNPDASHSRYK